MLHFFDPTQVQSLWSGSHSYTWLRPEAELLETCILKPPNPSYRNLDAPTAIRAESAHPAKAFAQSGCGLLHPSGRSEARIVKQVLLTGDSGTPPFFTPTLIGITVASTNTLSLS